MKVSEILVEYMVRPGNHIKEVLALNLFTDMEEGQRPSEHYEDFKNSKEWMAVERKYIPIAAKLEAAIVKSTKKLSEKNVDAVHKVWYDGSDAYGDPESAVEYLPKIYDEQIKVVGWLLNTKG